MLGHMTSSFNYCLWQWFSSTHTGDDNCMQNFSWKIWRDHL